MSTAVMSPAVIRPAVIGTATIHPSPTSAGPVRVVRASGVGAFRSSTRSATTTQRPESAPESTADAQPTVTPRLHLTRRGRVVLTVLAAVPLVLGALFFTIGGGGAAANSDASTATFSHVTVDSGQSLWQIAETVAPSADPRDVVAAIIDLNQLQSAMVMPGQQLAIPAQYAH